jgi:glycosyltransferase involved in cell wall biosynthesis
MRIALFCPFSHGPTRGNITSVKRIAKHLRQASCQVEFIPLDVQDRHDKLQKLALSPPDLLHAFHAFHAGPVARKAAIQSGIPYIITLTGSDLFDPVLRDHPESRQAIRDATAITCFDPLVAELADQTFPLITEKLVVIPQGVEPFPEYPAATRSDNQFIILLPSALRPVKGIDFAMAQLDPLIADLPNLQLWVVGGVLDTEYATTIRALAADLPWVHLKGEVPHKAMGQLYAAADLVLNSSLFEGGMANALLEAMIMAKPVLARNVPGNRSLIRHGKTGWLFQDGDELRQLIRNIAQKNNQRIFVGKTAQDYVVKHFSPKAEATSLTRLYQKTLKR